MILLALSLAGVLWLSGWAVPARPVSAQCAKPSTCKTCHETQAQAPVSALGAWHQQHAMFDFCSDCHYGDRISTDPAVAHQGATLSLNDMQGACASCHSGNWQVLIQDYGAQTGEMLTLSENPPLRQPEQANPLAGFFGGAAAGPQAPSAAAAGAAPAATQPDAPSQNTTGNLILLALIGVVSVGGGSYIYRNERRLGRLGAPLPAHATPGVSPRVSALLPRIARLEPGALDALASLLDDPEKANQLLAMAADLADAGLTLSKADRMKLVEQLRSNRGR